MKNLSRFAALLLAGGIQSLSTSALAADLMVNGEGSAPITADISITRETSLLAAKRDAVIAAIKKINGAYAHDDAKVRGTVDDIAKQIGSEYIFDQSTRRDAANNFVTTLKLKLDDKEFRKLISDAGIGVKTANSYPILVVMDEYFTTPTDTQKPLREVVEYFSDKSAHNKIDASASDQAAYSASASASNRDTFANSATGSRSTAVNAQSHGYYGGGAASGRESVNINAQASGSSANASASSERASASSSLSYKEDSGQKDVQSYKKLVEYQPQQTGPSDRSYTYEAILREAASYDLNILDNALFRSKYFTGKPLTLQELTNGPELARYVEAARDDLRADYFMAGSTIIYDLGKDPATGQSRCDGVVTLKAYATATSKVLATDARSESASGNSPDQCRVNVANKLAVFTGSVLGTQIAEYWKNRNMYGQQYAVKLVSLLGQLNFQLKRNFGKTIEQVRGIKEVPVKRKEDAREVEYSLQYNGDTPIGDAIGELLGSSDAFKAYPNFDVNTQGTTVRICLESSCPAGK
jgi:hypothetical protein